MKACRPTVGRVALIAAALALAALAQPGRVTAQTATPPGTVETAPLPPPAGTTTPRSAPPPVTLSQDPAPVPPAAAPPAATPPLPGLPRLTLLAKPGDPVDVDEVAIPDRPVATVTGTSTWDEGYANLQRAFRRIEEGAATAGIRLAGRPIAVFAQTDDTSFQYQAMIPIEPTPDSGAALPAGLKIGRTPAGPAYRFVHKGPYDDIDSTYETITTYLDAKNITARDAFIEEYATDAATGADPALEVNIFVQPK